MVHIEQHVVPRHRRTIGFSLQKLGHGGWRGKRHAHAARGQRGSITQSTLTISVGIVALLAVSVLGFVYLQQIFGTASQGADIHSLEQRLDDLQATQQSLELEGAKLRSIQAVEDRVIELNLVEADSVAYLAPKRGSVAVAR